MKIQILSDIHLEYYDYYPGLHYFLKPSAKILILAGDICYYKHEFFLKFFKEASFFFKYVLFVPGNHEYYTSTFIDTDFESFERADYEMKDILCNLQNVIFLQENTFTIGNINFIGATLWNDSKMTYNQLKKLNYTQNDNFVLYRNKVMPDPTKTDVINKRHYNWLSTQLNLHKNYYNIVITHFLPSKNCIDKHFQQYDDNHFFYTNCEKLFPKVNTWIYGHTHIGSKKYLKNTLLISNPHGLPIEKNKYPGYRFSKECIMVVPITSPKL
jgi:predicted phosphodiesterase